VRDDLVNLILRDVCTSRSRMPLLATSPPLGLATLGQQLLGLRARLRPPLLTRLRWILRRRPRTGPRVLARLRLQATQPLLEPLNPTRQLEDELNTRLAPRIIDRLRLDSIHPNKIRCITKRSWLWNPTTERLRFY
jgi:hypothetical protein